jgi:hypothetical protein
MQARHTLSILSGAILCAAGITVLMSTAAQAQVACTQTALVAAVNAANEAGGGNITLTPGCSYVLTSSNGGGTNGPDGLPVITTAITLTGNANIITRAATALPFRIVEVSASGNLTLKSVTLSNGSAALNGGGGILNAGAVTLTGSALSGNTAITGNGGGIYSGHSASAAATFTSSTLSGNAATVGSGGGIYSTGGTATFTSSSINGNTASIDGGGAASVNAIFTTTSTPVTANAALTAGGIYRLNGTMTVTTSPISGNILNNCVGSSPAVPSCTG